MAEWIWHNTPCRRLITNVPADNRLAFQFALSAGMEPYGKNEDSFLKGGKLLDQICLGISRPSEMPVEAQVSGEAKEGAAALPSP
jgi:hypothetical protein